MKIVADKDAFQGYKAIPSGNIADLYSTSFKQKKEIVVDFGDFLVQAMIDCGMHKEARQYVEQYWGGMVRLGADTFWENYVPDNHLFSSYNGFTLLNSYCHAWSCTPVCFIVNYPEIFQK